MSALALILARAGSKGVPRKNAAIIAGKPCIAWTIDAALASSSITRVVISTDDSAMAAITHSLGTHVINRPPELATDTARVDDAARHAVTETQKLWPLAAEPYTPIVILYGNVPVRPIGLIDRAVKTLLRTGADSVQSYAPVGKYHPWWTARIEPESGIARPWEGDTLNHNIFRRQDLPPAHIPDGGVLVVTRRALFGEIPGVAPGPHAFFGKDRRGVLNDEGAVIDIDSPTDLLVADALLRSPAR